MIQSVIFNLDGVLVDSEHAIRTAFLHMLEHYGVKATYEDCIPFTGMGEIAAISGVARRHGLEYKREMQDLVYEIYRELASREVKVFEGVPELIRALRRRDYRLAVASSSNDVKVDINLERAGFTRDDFDAVITGSHLTRNKPDPEIFRLAASQMGGEPSQCLVVEDALAGCQAARSAGMHCIAVASSFPTGQLRDAGAEYVVDFAVDILPLLKQY